MKKNSVILIIVFFLLFFKTNESADITSIMNSSLEALSYYYIQTNDELSNGILFTNSTGLIDKKQYPLIPGSVNNNALWNYNGSEQKTEYWIYIHVSNTGISLCHGATNHLCSNPGCIGDENYIIPINNAKWSKSFVNTQYEPSLINAIPFTIGFDNSHKIVEYLAEDKTIYFRYWLDVPPSVPPYIYNTTYQIMAVVGGNDC
ncbi:MAG: hypothetical protein QXJ06_00160 [Candidatus Aenigmatarchaeota archaeon]